MSTPPPNLSRRSSLINYFSNIPRPRLPSLRSRKSTSSSLSHRRRSAMVPSILSNPEVTAKVLEYILDSPNGRRSLSRLARTCKAFKEPALDLLWRDLDSFLPLISLFPSGLMKRSRRPALGFARNPEAADWERVLAYADRVHSIAYVEAYKNVHASYFPIFEQTRPRAYVLPNLTGLTWKVETVSALDQCLAYITPGLQSLTIEMGTKSSRMNDFLDRVISKTSLSSFSFTLHSNLPDSFVEILQPNSGFERLSLMAPGALSSRVGKWASSLPLLNSFQLDLSNRTTTAVEGFFDDISPGSGYSTPSSVGGTDSGVFSGDELDFSDLRKSALQVTHDGPRHGAFAHLSHLQLTGDTANCATFLKHITSPLTQIDLAIEDPPAKEDWQDVCNLICEQFSDTLRSLRISANSASRFNELVRSTSRAGDIQLRHLPLEHFAFLPHLTRLEIDLPESAIFHHRDITHLSRVCPSLEVLRLCNFAKFPQSFGSPFLTLEGIVPLLVECKRLHTLGLVVNAINARDDIYKSHEPSSKSLLRLHVGHSWIKDPLQTAILLSHLAPHLETVKSFSLATRPGSVDQNASAWAKVSEFLPHLQNLRLVERSLLPKQEVYVPPPTAEKSVDATVSTRSRAVMAKPEYCEASAHAFPALVDAEVEVIPETSSVSIDATPELVDVEISVEPERAEQEIDARPPTKEMAIDVMPEPQPLVKDEPPLIASLFPAFTGVLYFPLRAMQIYTYYITFPLRFVMSYKPNMPTNHANNTYAHANIHVDSTDDSSPSVPGSLHSTEDELIGSEKQAYMSSSFAENVLTEIPPDTIPPLASLNDIISPETISNETEHKPPAPCPSAGDPEELPEMEMCEHVSRQSESSAQDATRQSQPQSTETPQPLTTPWYTYPVNYNYYNMADPKKLEKDYTKEVDAILPEARSLAKSGKFQEAVDKLFVLEKQTRNASDLASTTRLVKEITQLAYDAKNYALVNSSIHVLSKKHGQLKGAIQGMVEQAMGWLEDIKKQEGTEKWLELIETLRTVTEGKLFLETPRARVTLLLSRYHESLTKSPTSTSPPTKDSLQIASDLLSDLQVETYSSMERREKTEFILEQMRLLIALARSKDDEKGVEGKKDAVVGGEAEWVKVRVGGRKVNESFLTQEENEDLKLKYYEMMIQYALNQSEYLDAAKYYYKVWETPSIKSDESGRGREALEHIVYNVVLAQHDNEQSDMLHRLFIDPALVKLELHYALVKCFTTPELMRWPGIEKIYGPHLRKATVFTSDKLWEDLHTRVIEHNIRIVAKYYTRITLARLTTLLDLTPQQAEETLSRLVVSGTVWARVDRPAGIVNFRRSRSAEDVMNDWSSDMQRLLSLVEKTWMGVNAAQAAQARVKAST